MSSPFPATLLREDLRGFTGYSSARTSAPVPARDPWAWLNANEAATPSAADPEGRSRRYPDPQPPELVETLADLWPTTPDRIVVGRGSDELIDLLVRALCRPGGDAVITIPPTFGMYAVSARLHGAPVVEVPQVDEDASWRVDTGAVARATHDAGARVVFVDSPGNPTGSVVPLREIEDLVEAVADQAVVVVDEAYGEFAAQRSAATLLEAHPTLVVTRTLSKAHALAGIRLGLALCHPELATVLRRVQAPYPLPAPVVQIALQALGPEALAATRTRVAKTLRLRDAVGRRLRDLPAVRAVYRSEANFLLLRVDDPDRVLGTLADAGVVIRDVRHHHGLEDAVRITVGTDEEMDALLTALADLPVDPTAEEAPR